MSLPEQIEDIRNVANNLKHSAALEPNYGCVPIHPETLEDAITKLERTACRLERLLHALDEQTVHRNF